MMLVEIKTTLSISDVDKHMDRIAIIRKFMDDRGDTRKITGAVAGGSVDDSVSEYAHAQGLYVVVQSGDAVEISDTPAGFKAREW